MTQSAFQENGAREFTLARNALAADDTLTALSHLEKALKLNDCPGWYSFLGYCIARERGQHGKGESLCRQSLQADPDNPDHNLNLARIFMASGNKTAALECLREGKAKGGGAELEALLNRIGRRRPPLFPALSRRNPLNRYLGLLLSRLGLR
jgi:Flp pilus assembly protein TadD